MKDGTFKMKDPEKFLDMFFPRDGSKSFIRETIDEFYTGLIDDTRDPMNAVEFIEQSLVFNLLNNPKNAEVFMAIMDTTFKNQEITRKSMILSTLTNDVYYKEKFYRYINTFNNAYPQYKYD